MCTLMTAGRCSGSLHGHSIHPGGLHAFAAIVVRAFIGLGAAVAVKSNGHNSMFKHTRTLLGPSSALFHIHLFKAMKRTAAP